MSYNIRIIILRTQYRQQERGLLGGSCLCMYILKIQHRYTVVGSKDVQQDTSKGKIAVCYFLELVVSFRFRFRLFILYSSAQSSCCPIWQNRTNIYQYVRSNRYTVSSYNSCMDTPFARMNVKIIFATCLGNLALQIG